MKILFIAPANNYHTQKWCRWFLSKGYEVSVISFIRGDIPGADVQLLNTEANTDSSDTKKIRYLLHARELRSLIETIQPDLISVHFASSYGTVMALTGLRDYTLSVWGADIYDFPRKSVLHRILLQFSLSRPAVLLSTSMAMAREGRKYTKKPFEITPFGVDMSVFNPSARCRIEDSVFVVGTVKALLPKYGIDYLIRAVSIVRSKRKDIPIRLKIAGKGANEQEYRDLANTLGLEDITEWLGFIAQEEVARAWADMDVAVVPSVLESESFGVSAVEAQACGTALVISDIPGLCEAASDGKTCVVVPRRDETALADAIIRLFDDPVYRRMLGRNGREFVCSRYEINNCFRNIESKLLESVSRENRITQR